MTRTKNFSDFIRSKLASNADLAALVEEESRKADEITVEGKVITSTLEVAEWGDEATGDGD